jgi:Concanavalin A-like lectin/glucanases superfamily
MGRESAGMTIVAIALVGTMAARQTGRVSTASASSEGFQTTWTFDRLDAIGGVPIRVEGHPKIIESPVGKAIEFNGVDDAVFIDRHPLAGAATFTFEAVFRPDGGSDFAQRWFHLAERDAKTGTLASAGSPTNPDTNSRFLFEVRTKDGQWWLDAFVTGAGYRSLLLFEDKKHPVGRWYHVAQTYDGRMHRSYVNGLLQGELALAAYKPMGPGAASVGTRINKVNYFKGAVRQARFTSRALTPAEFLKLPASD